MPVGGYYIDKSELDEFAAKLEATAGDIKDLTQAYRKIGKYAGNYVKHHEPLPSYDMSKDGPSSEPVGLLQAMTRGGGGKRGAYVSITGVPYVFVQEFGGGVFWHRYGAGAVRSVNRAHRSYADLMSRGAKGHIVYTKPRRRLGYFIWNVAYRLRSYIGGTLCESIQDIGAKHGLNMDIVDRNLDIKQKPGPTG